MIVVAIIGILAAVAIPQYQNYVLKSRLASAFSAVDAFKTGVATCMQENGGSNATCTTGSSPEIPTSQPTNEVSSISVSTGTITVNLRTGIGFGVADTTSVVLTLTPLYTEGDATVRWQVQGDNNAKQAVLDGIAKVTAATGT